MNTKRTSKSTRYACVTIGVVFGLLALWPLNVAARATPLASTAPDSFAQLVKGARESVVNIGTVKVIKSRGGPSQPFFGWPSDPNDPFHDFFDRFFKDQIPKDYRQRSLGSGFIIDEEGYILTNNHVVEKTDEIKVKLANEKEYFAEIVGRDPQTDLALIRIETDEPLRPLPLGDSEALEVGEWVVAIGNPFGLTHTVTAGIVSAKYRKIGAGSYENFIQTDAPINPGNSGGPLLNTRGEVVGINTAIFSRSGGSVGIGFAIPIDMAKELLPQLKRGKVVRGWLGVMIQKITTELKDKLDLTETRGALVADVTGGSPADKAGIQRGDVIVSFDGQPIKEMGELPFIVASTPVGKRVTVEVIRKGRKESLTVEVGKLEEGIQPGVREEEESDLGLTVEEITPELARRFGLREAGGLVVVYVERGSSADEAGLRQGDIILEIDQKPVRGLADYRNEIRRYKKGDTILFLVKRGNSSLYLTVKVWE
jgi:serine protease Do